MRLHLLAAGSVVALALWACGGDVVVDDPPSGAGGNGASGSTGASTAAQGANGGVGPGPGPGPSSVGPGVTTGPGPCSCQAGCEKVIACGESVQCDGICGADPELDAVLECICNAPGCDYDFCFATPQDCQDCMSAPFGGPCDGLIDECLETTGCLEVAQCYVACNFEPGCTPGCEAQFPQVVPQVNQLIQCAVCNVCLEECAGPVANQYCLDG